MNLVVYVLEGGDMIVGEGYVEGSRGSVTNPVYIKNVSGVLLAQTVIHGPAKPNAITFDIFRPIGVDTMRVEKYTAKAMVTNEESRIYKEYMKIMHPKDSGAGSVLKTV